MAIKENNLLKTIGTCLLRIMAEGFLIDHVLPRVTRKVIHDIYT
jgi:hypothetical protein